MKSTQIHFVMSSLAEIDETSQSIDQRDHWPMTLSSLNFLID